MLDNEDALAELRAIRNPSSRRGQTSITHLLNFSTPRPQYDSSHGHHNHSSRSYRRPPASSGQYVVDKARFVHANYRFVVSPESSYANQSADADLYINWPDVMQVIASTESQTASCPICLSEPVAPRMARCGHIFCLPCIIRFMSSSSSEEEAKSGKGARWKKCPICEDVVYLHEVRPLRFYAGQETRLPRVGDDVVLRLMSRRAHSTLALPKEAAGEADDTEGDVPWHFAANVLDYAHIMKGTHDYMEEQFDGEVEELVKQEKEDELLYGQDSEWTQKAIRAVAATKEKIAEIKTMEQAVPSSKRAAPKPAAESDFYFYSAPPHLYLSPLDIRILKTKYGSFSSFPSTLLPRVEHISTGHPVDDTVRKRAKYLGHLPHGCLISFLECDWTDIVPADVLSSFSEEIGKRRKRNRDKAAQEEREKLDAERLEAAAMRGAMTIRASATLDADVTPPSLDLSEFQPLNSTPPDSRTGFTSLASMSTSPSTYKTVWGTRAVPASPELGAIDTGDGNDGWLKDDEFLGTAELALELDAIDAATEVTPAPAPAPVPSPAAPTGGSNKKKKKQKITLMSTGGRRGL